MAEPPRYNPSAGGRPPLSPAAATTATSAVSSDVSSTELDARAPVQETVSRAHGAAKIPFRLVGWCFGCHKQALVADLCCVFVAPGSFTHGEAEGTLFAISTQSSCSCCW